MTGILSNNRGTTVINIQHIIGGNCILDVQARITPAEPDCNVGEEVEILEVTHNGEYFETDDIYIKTRYGIEALDKLIEQEVWDARKQEPFNFED